MTFLTPSCSRNPPLTPFIVTINGKSGSTFTVWKYVSFGIFNPNLAVGMHLLADSKEIICFLSWSDSESQFLPTVVTTAVANTVDDSISTELDEVVQM